MPQSSSRIAREGFMSCHSKSEEINQYFTEAFQHGHGISQQQSPVMCLQEASLRNLCSSAKKDWRMSFKLLNSMVPGNVLPFLF